VKTRTTVLVRRIRAAKGPFFLARVALQTGLPLTDPDLRCAESDVKKIVEACRELGYDPEA
jgi:hypothetical protein